MSSANGSNHICSLRSKRAGFGYNDSFRVGVVKDVPVGFPFQEPVLSRGSGSGIGAD